MPKIDVQASIERLTLVNEKMYNALQRTQRYLARQSQAGTVPAIRTEVEEAIAEAERSSNLGHRW